MRCATLMGRHPNTIYNTFVVQLKDRHYIYSVAVFKITLYLLYKYKDSTCKLTDTEIFSCSVLLFGFQVIY